MNTYELGVIGGGNMAEAIVTAAAKGGMLSAGQIVVGEPSVERRRVLAEKLGVACEEHNGSTASAPRVLLAVKPQVMSDVLRQIAGDVSADALVISIAAGVSCAKLDAGLGGQGRIVRVMPNTPMLVGAGMSAVCAGPRATEDDVDWVCKLLACGGEAVVVDESQMDAVTAVSGSGPAYFFYLVEAMVAAGVAEGLSEADALALARQTCLGAGKLMADSGDAPAELRRRVTSPGGTTQRAIETMEAQNVQSAIVEAVRSAAARSRELGA